MIGSKRYNWVGVLLLLVFVFDGCVDLYQPPEVSAPNTYLVVDGFLNGAGTSTIRLSRTQNLAENRKPPVETNALVQVEAEQGGSQNFVDKGDGTYTLTDGGLQFGQNYRLRIKTANGRSYLSDYVTIKRTPKIDSLTWKPQREGVQFYVTTHDPTNSTKYYRWEYEETWEYYSAFYSQFEYLNREFVYRPENINHCWRTEKSTGISVGSSVKLTQDVINQLPLVFVSHSASNRLKVRYSLLVKQYALTNEAYEYWLNLKKNTESLGSLFDPQPFQTIGNIHGVTDPNEFVVGYLSGYSVEEKRLFVSPLELPSWRVPTGYEGCEADTFLLNPPPEEVGAEPMAEAGWLPIDAIISPQGIVYAYRLGPPDCVDCRLVGTNVKPSFW
ncbi:DUF4249 domain-containing protein [Larkinella bovis]|uniref:DUF4249 domain-containing protein n=1 Tax=Larkinella bovis TaxID=683041 RepID=A0ABW0IG06_9BACT